MLILTCLKGQDEQREGLLKSLGDQLEKLVNNTKEVSVVTSVVFLRGRRKSLRKTRDANTIRICVWMLNSPFI